MSSALTTNDFARFEAASRVLLSPLAAPTVADWQAEVASTTRAVFGADHAVFGITGQPHVLDGIDAGTWGCYAEYVTQSQSAWGAQDPVVDRWLRAHHASGGGAFDEALIDSALRPLGLALCDSELMNGVAWPNRMYGLRGVTAAAGTGEAGLQFTYERPCAARSEGVDLPWLRALLPSFRAGLDALVRFDGQRAALDAVAEPLAVFDADGRELHRNAALVRLFDGETERERVGLELRLLIGSLRGLAFRRRGEDGGPPPGAERRVATARGAYTFRGALLPPGAFAADGALMVSVHLEAGPQLPPPAVLRERFGLTKREAEVALLLVEGLKNDQVADRLFVSPHTARHHVESVLAKLEVPNRAAVAIRLMQAA